MLPMSKIKKIMRCIGSMMLRTFPLLFPHPTKSKPVKFKRIRISLLIRMKRVKRRYHRESRRHMNTIAECEPFLHHIAGVSNYAQLENKVRPYQRQDVGEVQKLRGFKRIDSLRKESNFRNFRTAIFVHPSSLITVSISSRNWSAYSGYVARLYKACVNV